MSSNKLENEIFVNRQSGDIAIITFLPGAHHEIFSTTGANNRLVEVFDNIQNSGDVKGVVIIYPTDYPGNEDYLSFVSEIFKEAPGDNKARFTVTFKYH